MKIAEIDKRAWLFTYDEEEAEAIAEDLAYIIYGLYMAQDFGSGFYDIEKFK